MRSPPSVMVDLISGKDVEAAMARCRDHASWKLYTDPSSCGICAVNDTILSTGANTAGERWGAEGGAARPIGCAGQLCSN